jgi:iduronate 2-sulfatase
MGRALRGAAALVWALCAAAQLAPALGGDRVSGAGRARPGAWRARSAAPGYNVVLVVMDDLRSFETDPLAVAPNMKALAARGVSFRNAQTEKSDCAPSRLAMLSGRRVDALRVWDFAPEFRKFNPRLLTLPGLARRAGYTTRSIGKVLDPRSFTAAERGDQCPPSNLNNSACSWDLVVNVAKEAPSRCGMPKLYPYPSARQARAGELGVHTFADADEPYAMDACVAKIAVAHMGELAAAGSPFFLAVGLVATHLPWIAPQSVAALFSNATLPDARVWSSIAQASKALPFFHNESSYLSWTNSNELTQYKRWPPNKADWVRAYYASLAWMDQQVGRIIRAVDALREPVRDKTLVLLWSDNGVHMGEHETWLKKTVFDRANTVPLIVLPPTQFRAANPGWRAGRVVSAPVQSTDIMPTLLDMLEIPDVLGGDGLPQSRAGTSLVPLMLGQLAFVRQAAVSQYWSHRTENKRTIMAYSIRTMRHRFIAYFPFKSSTKGNGLQYDPARAFAAYLELYDYSKDGAYEKVNRVNDTGYVAIKQRFLDMIAQRTDRDWNDGIGIAPFDL